MIFVLTGLLFGALSFAATRRIVSPILVFLTVWFMSWAGLPTLAFGFYGLPVFVLIAGLAVWIEECIHSSNRDATQDRTRHWGAGIMTGTGLLFLTIVPMFSTWALFHGDDYYGLIGDVTESTFSTDTSPLDPTQVRIVDSAIARRLGEKRLGEDPSLGSRVNLGAPRIQQVNNDLVWVIPLSHSGFMKWWYNSRGTPGYVTVSATDESDVRLVQQLDGDDIHLKYNAGSFWSDSLERHLYTNGYSTVGLTDFTFEIDDTGKPYWVVTQYDKTVGFSGEDASGVLVMDAQTGEIEPYDIDEAPAWIDRIQPHDFVARQLDDWGMFVHGWYNPGGEDRLGVTEGITLVYGEDGRSYWYTGMSSRGADDSTIGFALVDTRTKEAHLYKQPGATEIAAARSAEGAVQEKDYNSSFPILYNVSGMPTYFTTLKDKAGLVKMVAFVSVENYEVVGVGDNVQSALRTYRRAVASKGNAVAPDTVVTIQEVTGKILRMAKDTEGNYYFVIQGQENKAFIGGVSTSVELPLSREGDTITVAFEDGGNETVDITRFDNLGLQFQKTEAQIGVERRREQILDGVRTARTETNADATWEELSAEQKAEALKRLTAEGKEEE